MVVCLTVSQTLFLIMPGTEEWLLTLGTHKMLNINKTSCYQYIFMYIYLYKTKQYMIKNYESNK